MALDTKGTAEAKEKCPGRLALVENPTSFTSFRPDPAFPEHAGCDGQGVRALPVL